MQSHPAVTPIHSPLPAYVRSPFRSNHSVFELSVTSRNFGIFLFAPANEPCALSWSELPGLTLPTDSAGLVGTGTQAGVGVGVGVAGVVGVAVGVTTEGDPRQILIALMEIGTGVADVLPPPPPQLNNAAAVRKPSTGAITRVLRRQNMEH